MLKISKNQVDQLENLKRTDFAERLALYLSSRDPFHAEALGNAGMLSYAQIVIQRAAVHGFTQKSTIQLYGQVMMYLGTFFDTDPALPWARATLERPLDMTTTKTDQANALRDGLLEYLEKVSGVYGELAQSFLEDFVTFLKSDELVHYNGQPGDLLARLYPALHREIPENALYYYSQLSVETCRAARLTRASSHAIMFCLMANYGHQMRSDPLFPWLVKFLHRAPNLDRPDDVFLKLVEKFVGKIVTYVAEKKQG